MSNFAVFMAGNANKNENVKYVASKRFVDKGKPVEWDIKAIDSDLDEALRKEFPLLLRSLRPLYLPHELLRASPHICSRP